MVQGRRVYRNWFIAWRKNSSRRLSRVARSRSGRPCALRAAGTSPCRVVWPAPRPHPSRPRRRRPARRCPASPQHLGCSLRAVAEGGVAAQRAQVHAGGSCARAVPVDQAGQGAIGPQGVAVPQVAVHEHGPAFSTCRTLPPRILPPGQPTRNSRSRAGENSPSATLETDPSRTAHADWCRCYSPVPGKLMSF
jgi:hypothetical protein